ncbi:MAG: hypothetical protein R2684_17420 [Pyrinomonadaceae bacterium]
MYKLLLTATVLTAVALPGFSKTNSGFARESVFPSVSSSLVDDVTSTEATLAIPSLPEKAKWNSSDAIVRVEISVDDKGKVFSAKAVSGDLVLTKPSEDAAMESSFTPAEVEGEKLAMNGVLVYQFADRDKIEIGLESMNLVLTPTVKKALTKRYKLHFWIYELVERIEKQSDVAGEFESRFVSMGKADIKVIVSDDAKTPVAELTKAGLEIYKENGASYYGKIDPEKIIGLAELDFVLYVSP